MLSTVLGSGDTVMSVIRSLHHGVPCLVEEREKQSQRRGADPALCARAGARPSLWPRDPSRGS